MPNLQIRDVPQDVYEALKTDAALEQRSLTQQAIVALRQAQQQQRSGQRLNTIDALRASRRRLNFGQQTPEVLIQQDRQR